MANPVQHSKSLPSRVYRHKSPARLFDDMDERRALGATPAGSTQKEGSAREPGVGECPVGTEARELTGQRAPNSVAEEPWEGIAAKRERPDARAPIESVSASDRRAEGLALDLVAPTPDVLHRSPGVFNPDAGKLAPFGDEECERGHGLPAEMPPLRRKLLDVF